jgi:hypothetical protein
MKVSLKEYELLIAARLQIRIIPNCPEDWQTAESLRKDGLLTRDEIREDGTFASFTGYRLTDEGQTVIDEAQVAL